MSQLDNLNFKCRSCDRDGQRPMVPWSPAKEDEAVTLIDLGVSMIFQWLCEFFFASIYSSITEKCTDLKIKYYKVQILDQIIEFNSSILLFKVLDYFAINFDKIDRDLVLFLMAFLRRIVTIFEN